MDDLFIEAYKSSIENYGAFNGAELAENYVKDIQNSIEELNNVINNFSNNGKNISQLKGDIFEVWHNGTFKIDALAKRTGETTNAPRVTRFASPDITTSWGEIYGLKDYHNARASAQEQAISYQEYYRAKVYNQQQISFEDFCKKQGFDNPDELFHDPIYSGQKRLIPEDQIDTAKAWLRRKIIEEQNKRPELVEKYQDTLDNLTDRVKSPNGAESSPLNEENSRQISADAKNNNFDAEKYGISTENYIKYEQILNQSLRAGVNAAILTAILKLTPDIIISIQKIFNDENISIDDLKSMGLDCLSISSKSFIRGSIAAGITALLKTGLFGEATRKVDPFLVGTITAVALNTIENAVKMFKGKMTLNEFANVATRDIIIASFAYTGTLLFQSFITIPFVGALLGNIVGGIIGSFVFNTYNNIFLSFCAETGYTFLGIVEQDYALPIDVLKDMGLDTVIPDICLPDNCYLDICEPDICTPDMCEPDYAQPYIIKRGVIGINKVGYILQ